MEHILRCADEIKRQMVELRMMRDADMRIAAIEKAETQTWRVEIRVRVDTVSKAIEDLKLAAAARGNGGASSNPAMAALSAAGGGGGMFMVYIIGKALGLVQ